ncbi:MAG TPA: hypothetical protein DIW47_10185 [Bacteroidetes bacterium]|nr:hypothetical protein [Bacteroidota bacterium]
MLSCANPSGKNQNPITITSTNKDSLGLLINLKTYTPKKVIYRFSLYDNSAKSRLDISAPSDSYLEAILIYDSVPEIAGNRIDGDLYPFEFDWLPNDFSGTYDKEIFQSGIDSLFSRNGRYALSKNAVFLKVNWN